MPSQLTKFPKFKNLGKKFKNLGKNSPKFKNLGKNFRCKFQNLMLTIPNITCNTQNMEDWIEWYAQENEGRFEGPLADDVFIEVMMLDGEIDAAPAGNFNWGLIDEGGEIIAYREITDELVIVLVAGDYCPDPFDIGYPNTRI